MTKPEILYANGCSMTYGDEIVARELDETPGYKEYREKHAWPGQLAELLDIPHVVNEATPGGSNDRVYRTTLEWITKIDPSLYSKAFVCIGWSSPNRREFPHILGNDMQWARFLLPAISSKETRQKLIAASGRDIFDFMTLYYENIAHEVPDKRRSLGHVVMLQSILRQLGIRYLFLDALNKTYLRIEEFAELDALAGQVDERCYFGFADKAIHNVRTFSGFIAHHEYPRGSNWHPLEDGHEAWAKVLYAYIRSAGLVEVPV